VNISLLGELTRADPTTSPSRVSTSTGSSVAAEIEESTLFERVLVLPPGLVWVELDAEAERRALERVGRGLGLGAEALPIALLRWGVTTSVGSGVEASESDASSSSSSSSLASLFLLLLRVDEVDAVGAGVPLGRRLRSRLLPTPSEKSSFQ
jgi:hypothetical protein